MAIAFVAMPFGKRQTGNTGSGTPKSVNFDLLWDLALMPALEQLGFDAIRADEQAGTVIIKDMLEQLVYADLVIADITLANANVYYEAGIRHVAKQAGCVLISADWANVVFDLAQVRRLTYPLPNGEPNNEDLERIKKILVDKIPAAANRDNPIYELTGYPNTDPASLSSFKDYSKKLAAFQKEVRVIRLAESLITEFLKKPLQHKARAKEILLAIRDLERGEGQGSEGFRQVIEFIDKLQEDIKSDSFFVEQYSLAVSKVGDHFSAIAALEQLIQDFGATPERCGLLGGRYKKLFYEHGTEEYLEKSIQAYEKGYQLDFNEYYCSSNISRLLRARERVGDEARARYLGCFTVEVCENLRCQEKGDEWLKPTLLAAAFDSKDLSRVASLIDEIGSDGEVKAWKIGTVLQDAKFVTSKEVDENLKLELQSLITRLEALEN